MGSGNSRHCSGICNNCSGKCTTNMNNSNKCKGLCLDCEDDCQGNDIKQDPTIDNIIILTFIIALILIMLRLVKIIIKTFNKLVE